MHARLSTYAVQVDDRSRYEEAAGSGGAAPSVIDMLLALEGCRGAWALTEEVPDDVRVDRFTETFLSLWETREQAEAVRDRLGPQIVSVLDGGGASLTGPPDTRVLLVLAGRVG